MWRSFVSGLAALAAVSVPHRGPAQDHAVSFNVGLLRPARRRLPCFG